jgi:hypothetical protein
LDFKGDSVPVVSSVSDDSPVKGKIKAGYKFVALILKDGTDFLELKPMELLDVVGKTANKMAAKSSFRLLSLPILPWHFLLGTQVSLSAEILLPLFRLILPLF